MNLNFGWTIIGHENFKHIESKGLIPATYRPDANSDARAPRIYYADEDIATEKAKELQAPGGRWEGKKVSLVFVSTKDLPQYIAAGVMSFHVSTDVPISRVIGFRHLEIPTSSCVS